MNTGYFLLNYSKFFYIIRLLLLKESNNKLRATDTLIELLKYLK